jgi:hypothetical protein
MTHREFLENPALHPVFFRACKLAQITPTTRQVSKWHHDCGAARQNEAAAKADLEREERDRREAALAAALGGAR